MDFPVLSTVAKKIFLAVTGLCLAGFLMVHLAGNFLLYVGADAFNLYAHTLMSMCSLLYVAEIVLAGIFAIHLCLAVYIQIVNWRARPERYKKTNYQGKPSRITISSRTMIWSGLIIIIFTVIHVITFKYGPGIEEGYVTNLNGEEVRDLYRLVAESFGKEYYVFSYLAVMVVLGYHLKHAIWSAIHTLGLTNPSLLPAIYFLSTVASVAFGAGFFLIPVWFYFLGGTL